MTLDELNKIDLKALVNAPAVVKLGVLVFAFTLTLFMGYWWVLSANLAALHTAQQTELSLRDEFKTKKDQVASLPAYQMQLGEVNQSILAMLNQLPNNSNIDTLLSDINQAGLSRGLSFDIIKPGAESMQGLYVRIPIEIQVTGAYHDFGHFVSDIAQFTRIATFRNIHIQKGNNGQLTMHGEVDTYRYLTPSELAGQKTMKKGTP